jgi:hypothetical protein
MRGSKEACRTHWLIAKHGVSGIDVLTVDLGGGAKALAVFSVEEDTRKFLHARPGASGEEWKARQTWPGEWHQFSTGLARPRKGWRWTRRPKRYARENRWLSKSWTVTISWGSCWEKGPLKYARYLLEPAGRTRGCHKTVSQSRISHVDELGGPELTPPGEGFELCRHRKVGGMITRGLLEQGREMRILVRRDPPSSQLVKQGLATSAEARPFMRSRGQSESALRAG